MVGIDSGEEQHDWSECTTAICETPIDDVSLVEQARKKEKKIYVLIHISQQSTNNIYDNPKAVGHQQAWKTE